MINFMSSWAEQIVLAVIIATIIEMILPKNKNKKYIQMVIGVYVLCNIISPIVKNKDAFSIEKYSIENYETKYQNEVDQSSMDERLEKIYLEELKETVISKFEENGIEVVKCNIDAILDTTKKNAGIHSITVKIKSFADESMLAKIKRELVTEFEIEERKIIISVKRDRVFFPEKETRSFFQGGIMLKDFFKKGQEGEDKKKQIENIVVFIIILIVTVLIINSMWLGEESESKENTIDASKVLAQTTSSQQDELEGKLEDILESMNGVGKVKVLIKYSESSTIVAMYNETISESISKENDGDGGTKDVKEIENKKEIVYSDEDGTNKPITEKVVMPVIEGAIITAQGAGNANVKASIVSAVEAVTGLAVHKIQVFEMGSK